MLVNMFLLHIQIHSTIRFIWSRLIFRQGKQKFKILNSNCSHELCKKIQFSPHHLFAPFHQEVDSSSPMSDFAAKRNRAATVSMRERERENKNNINETWCIYIQWISS